MSPRPASNVSILHIIANLGESKQFNAYVNSVGHKIKEWVYHTHIHRYNQTTMKDTLVALAPIPRRIYADVPKREYEIEAVEVG